MEMKDDFYGLYSPGRSGWTSQRNPEFQEADMWEVFQDAMAPDSASRRLPTTPARTIPKPNKTSDRPPPKISQHSAPVNIPDWAKIYGSGSKNTTLRNSYSWLSDADKGASYGSLESEDDHEEEEEKWNDVIPPHEWIARRVSRSEIFSFSVCEGAGRTLKGRDLSRVRNAVLAKTGFLESNSNH